MLKYNTKSGLCDEILTYSLSDSDAKDFGIIIGVCVGVIIFLIICSGCGAWRWQISKKAEQALA
jgi:uncharacterized metal-binding protein